MGHGAESARLRAALLAGAGDHAQLLQHASDIGYRPLFDDLPVADAVDHDAVGFDFPVRRVSAVSARALASP